MNQNLSRRQMLTRGGGCLAGVAALTATAMTPAQAAETRSKKDERPFRYSLNTGTIRGQKLSLREQVELTAKAGYDGIEPWMRDVHHWSEQGGSLADLKKRISDLGLAVVGAIGFPCWIVDDDRQRRQGLETMKRDMDTIARLGGRWIAAPPAGATRATGMDLRTVAERYRTVLELGDRMGVVPQLEIWGPSKTLSRIGEAAFVAVEAGHPKACILLDAYHIYKGGSDIAGLRLLSGAAMHAFHINDYPGDPARSEITDAHRIYPGDGIAPLPLILRTLRETGFRGYLSLELFNRDYWKQDAALVARTGLAKIRRVVTTSGTTA